MTTATLTNETRDTKLTPLSSKTTAWCRKVASVAAKRIFRVKALAHLTSTVGTDSLEFFLLPKIYHRKRISHNLNGQILLHPEFFDEKGNIRKKLSKELRTELKAAIFKEVAHFVTPRTNHEFYKIMVRCPWVGPRVDGAKGSKTEARKELDARREKKLKNRRSMNEVPTGLREDVKMWSLTDKKHILVKDAEVFIADGKIKVARGTHNGKKLRTMLPGGAELAAKLNL